MQHDDTESSQPESNDFAEMQRQIEALLRGGDASVSPETERASTGFAPEAVISPGAEIAPEAVIDPEPGPEPWPQAGPAATSSPSSGTDGPTTATPDIRDAALEAEPIDPLLREIDAALADDADALLRDADGDIDGALRSVFDERALSGQEEEINRALIEAFGTSRVERPSFAPPGGTPAVVTNPVPAFEGSARAISPDIPREDRDRGRSTGVDASVVAPAAASADPARVDAAPIVSTAPETQVSHGAMHGAGPTVASAPIHETPAHPANPATMTTTIEAKPEPTAAQTAPAGSSGALRKLTACVRLPLQIAAAPTRALPPAARTIVGLVAITLVLWTPVAWWLAQRAAQIPAVAPITIKPAVVAAAASESSSAAAGH
jgi:hypothetical protein